MIWLNLIFSLGINSEKETILFSSKQKVENSLLSWTIGETEAHRLIYPAYGARFDILHKWFEKFRLYKLL